MASDLTPPLTEAERDALSEYERLAWRAGDWHASPGAQHKLDEARVRAVRAIRAIRAAERERADADAKRFAWLVDATADGRFKRFAEVAGSMWPDLRAAVDVAMEWDAALKGETTEAAHG